MREFGSVRSSRVCFKLTSHAIPSNKTGWPSTDCCGESYTWVSLVRRSAHMANSLLTSAQKMPRIKNLGRFPSDLYALQSHGRACTCTMSTSGEQYMVLLTLGTPFTKRTR